MLLIGISAKAQDSKKAFEKAVDYCNCKMTFAYLNQFTSSMPKDKAEKVSFDKIKEEFGNCEISSPINFLKLSELLNGNNFKYSNQKFSTVIDQLKSSYNESFTTEQAVNTIIDGIFKNQNLITISSKYSDVAKLNEPLKSDIAKILGNSFAANNTSTNDGVEEVSRQSGEKIMNYEAEILDLKRKIKENEPSPFLPNWLSIILIVVFSLLVYAILKLNLSRLDERIGRHREEIEGLKSRDFTQSQNFSQSNSISDYKKAIDRNITEINNAISKLQMEVGTLTMSMQQKSNQVVTSVSSTEKPQKFEILYAPIPNRDGSFNASKVTGTEDQSASFYKFTITDILSQKATFEFLNVERAIKDATSSPELILNPVCRIKNALNQNAKRIKTVKPGTVVKQNDKWIVDQPAEIEYE